MLARFVSTALSLLVLASVHAAAAGYRQRILVPPSAMHSVEGIVLDADGQLLGTSIHSQRVYRIDTATGRVAVLVEGPQGESDDVAAGPSGTVAAGMVAWTALRSGEVRARYPDGRIAVLLRDVPRINPITFDSRGRLFAAQSGSGDETLWQIDPVGREAARPIVRGTRLNGFAFGPDGRLYAPHFGTDQIVRIDVDTASIATFARNLGAPAAVRVGRDGAVYSVDYLRGDLWRTEADGGTSRKLATVREPLDSLAVADDGRVFVSATADSSILVYEPASGTMRTLVKGWFTLPAGMTLTQHQGRAALLVADPLGYRFVDPASGVVTRPPWAGNRDASTAVAANATRIAAVNGPVGRLRIIDRASDAVLNEVAQLNAPRGVLLLDDQSVLVVEAGGGQVLRWDGRDRKVVARDLGRPVALTRESERTVLVSDYDGGRIWRVQLGSGERRVVVSGLYQPTGLALLPGQQIAVAEGNRGRVLQVDLRSGRRTVLTSGLPVPPAGLDLPADTPTGLVADSRGVLYVACPGDNSIRVLEPDRTRDRRK